MGTLKVCLVEQGQLFRQIACGSFPEIACLRSRNDAESRVELISNSQTSLSWASVLVNSCCCLQHPVWLFLPRTLPCLQSLASFYSILANDYCFGWFSTLLPTYCQAPVLSDGLCGLPCLISFTQLSFFSGCCTCFLLTWMVYYPICVRGANGTLNSSCFQMRACMAVVARTLPVS